MGRAAGLRGVWAETGSERRQGLAWPVSPMPCVRGTEGFYAKRRYDLIQALKGFFSLCPRGGGGLLSRQGRQEG